MFKKITLMGLMLLPLMIAACGKKGPPLSPDKEYEYPGKYPKD